jgi:hypothetical protein
MDFYMERFFITITLLVLLALGVWGHLETHKRIEELKQLQLEKIEKEKNVIGYWVMNQDTCQYEYEVKI